jgi:hypothetical protein
MTTAEAVYRQYKRLLLTVARHDEDKVQDALLYLVGHNVGDLDKAVGLAILHIKSAYKMEYRHDSVQTKGLALVYGIEQYSPIDTTQQRLAIYRALPKLCEKYRAAIMQYLEGRKPNKDVLFRARQALKAEAITLL